MEPVSVRRSAEGEGSEGRRISRLVVGIFVLAIGLALFAGQLDLFPVPEVSRLWPLVLIVFGLVRLAFPYRRHGASGWWMLLAGLYCGAGEWHLFGLTWSTAWPLFLVGAGVGMVVRALLARPKTDAGA